MIARAIPKVIKAMQDRVLISCSTADTGSLTFFNPVAAISGTSIGGYIIDRLGIELVNRRWLACMPYAVAETSNGTTEAWQLTSLSIRLQHGASSGGGDMADYVPIGGVLGDGTTGALTRNVGSTVATTPMSCWTTGVLLFQTPPGIYNLQGANRFLRTMLALVKPLTSFGSSGYENMRVSAGLVFLAADELPDKLVTTGPLTTSTSTST